MSDPYATHLPVLRLVLALVKPLSVLELGAGEYSTRFFLDAGVGLTTLESDETWFHKAEGYGDFDLRLVEDMSLPPLDLYDLVFIDNGTSAAERSPVIRDVLSQPHPVTVIHDAEHYMEDIIAAEHHIFDKVIPYTAVCW